jgi:amino acid permease
MDYQSVQLEVIIMGNKVGVHHLSEPLFTVARDQSAGLYRMSAKAHKESFAFLGYGSMRSCIFAFAAVLLGVNPFFIPRIMSRLGLVPGFVAICVACFSMLFLSKILAKVRDEVCRNTYGGIIEKQYGKLAQYLSEILILAYSLAQMTFHQLCLSKLVSSFLEWVISTDQVVSEAAIVIINVVIVLPCTLYIRHLTEMKYILSIPVISTLFMVILMLVRAPEHISTSVHTLESFHVSNLSIVSWEALAELLLSFDCSRFVLIVSYELTGYSYRRITKILDKSYGLVLILYLIIGCLGYVTYVGSTPDWMLVDEKLAPAADWGSGTLRVLFILSLIVTMPLNMIPARLSLLHLISGTTTHPTNKQFVWSTVAILALTVTFCVFWYETLYYFSSFALVVILACCLPSKS